MAADAPSIDLTHHFLIAMPGMEDAAFARSVVYLCEHSARGALGLVINKPSDINLRHLFDKVELPLGRDDLPCDQRYIRRVQQARIAANDPGQARRHLAPAGAPAVRRLTCICRRRQALQRVEDSGGPEVYSAAQREKAAIIPVILNLESALKFAGARH